SLVRHPPLLHRQADLRRLRRPRREVPAQVPGQLLPAEGQEEEARDPGPHARRRKQALTADTPLIHPTTRPHSRVVVLPGEPISGRSYNCMYPFIRRTATLFP